MTPVRTVLCRAENCGGLRAGTPRWLVMHYTANDGDSDEGNAAYFARAITRASAHYFVDDDSVTRSVPDERVAWHCGARAYRHPLCRNANSIGIELCDTVKNGRHDVTELTLRNAAALAASLCGKYGIPTAHILRHYDVTGKLCPSFWCGEGADGFARFRQMAEEELEMVEDGTLVVDGTEYAVRRILKDGVNYVRVRDLAAACGYETAHRGSVPVLTKKVPGGGDIRQEESAWH